MQINRKVRFTPDEVKAFLIQQYIEALGPIPAGYVADVALSTYRDSIVSIYKTPKPENIIESEG